EQRAQPLPLLLLAADGDQRPGAQAVAGERGPDPCAAPVELLADQRSLEQAERRYAACPRDVQVHQAECVRPLDHVGRVGLVLVVLCRARPDLLLRALVRERPQRALLRGELERETGVLCHRLQLSLPGSSIVGGATAAATIPPERRPLWHLFIPLLAGLVVAETLGIVAR